MVAIPTYLVLGDGHLNGPTGVALAPQPGAQGTYWTNSYNKPLLMQTVPTAGAAYAPWWDGTAGDSLTANAAANGATGYDVNNGGGYAALTTSIAVDGGTGDILVGDRIKFAGHATWYEVTTGVTEPSGTIVITPGLTASVADLEEITVAASVTVTTTPWTTDSEVGRNVQVDGGTGGPVNGVCQVRFVIANTTSRLFVTAAWSTLPTASAIHVQVGAWVVYDHIRGADNILSLATTEGDNWYANQNGSFGFTAALMQLLKGYHDSTGFKVAKLANTSGIASWKSGGSGSTSLIAMKALYDADMGADTADYRGIILWASAADIVALNLAYLADLTAAIANLRSIIGDTDNEVPVWVISHKSEYLQVSKTMTIGAITAPYATFLKQVHVALRSVITNYHVVDMEFATWGADSAVAPSTISANPSSYSTQSHLELGERVFNAIVRYYADVPSTESGTLPCVVLIGDSQAAGQMSPQYAILGGEESMLGPSGTVRLNQWIWNDVEQAWEPYDIAGNANTLGEPGGTGFGPEARLLATLADRFPDGVSVFKMAKGGATLAFESLAEGGSFTYDPAAGDLWDELGTAWNAARLAALQDLGLTLDTIAGVFLLGDNDSFGTTSSTAFSTDLPDFVDAFRTRFSTRSTGGDLPIVSHKIVQHQDSGGPSDHGLNAPREAIRAAVVARAAADSAFYVVSDEGLELLRSDEVHYSGRSQDTLGIRLGEKILEVIDGEAAAASSEDTPSGAASFTVETGSGATDSNSYCSVATADTYHIEHGNPSAWANADVIQKQDWLRQATQAIDLTYSGSWLGLSATSTQALAWPMAYAVDRAGYLIASTTIPTALQHATAMLGLQMANGEVILPQTLATADIASESKSIGPMVRSIQYRGGKPTNTSFPAVTQMLRAAGLIDWASGGWGHASL